MLDNDVDGAGPQDQATLLTIRVSRDSGRSFGPAVVVRSGDELEPLLMSAWPDCDCPQHRARG